MDELDLQKAARKLVNDHVYVCQSYLVDELLRKGVFEYDDIKNLEQPRDEFDLQYEYEAEWEIYKWAVNEDIQTFIQYWMTKNESTVIGYSLDELEKLFPDEWDEWETILVHRERIEEEGIDTFFEYLETIHDIDRWNLIEETEIYEWWVVSGWLEYKLSDLGHPFLENEYGTWWGRCGTGQAIYMDSDFQKLAKNYG